MGAKFNTVGDEFEMFAQTIRKFLALGLGALLSATNVAAYYDDSVCHPCMVVRCALPDWIPDDQSGTRAFSRIPLISITVWGNSSTLLTALASSNKDSRLALSAGASSFPLATIVCLAAIVTILVYFLCA